MYNSGVIRLFRVMNKSVFVCKNCGEKYPKWVGRCAQCGEWDMVEEVLSVADDKKVTGEKIAWQSLTTKAEERWRIGVAEIDRVFGGGIVWGSVTLFAGEPGIGKSTLALQMAVLLANQQRKVAYFSAEESVTQVSGRAQRLQLSAASLGVMHVEYIEDVLETMSLENPELVVVDSIQTIRSRQQPGLAGSLGQVRAVAEQLTDWAKEHQVAVIIIGQVNKEGDIAGPRVMEHVVDTVLFLEGERSGDWRLLKTFKNRYGATDEVGVFKMTEKGLVGVDNPAGLFLSAEQLAGTAVTAVEEGTRTFLVELQALVAYTKFGYPKRTATGMDLARLQMLVAVVGRHAGVNLDNYDIYINSIGGLKIRQTSIDLAVCAALISARSGQALPERWVFIGEVGLSGEVRPVRHLERAL